MYNVIWNTGLGLGIVVALLLLLLIAASTFQSWNRLRHIPGPVVASFSSLWMLRKIQSGKFHEHMREASNKYGPLVRIGPNDLLCTDPDALRRISAVRSHYTKGDFYETGRIIPGFDNVVCQRDEVKHKALRAKMSAGYAGRDNSRFDFESSVDRQLHRLFTLIDTKYVSTTGSLRPFNLCIKSQFFALDVISDISFGKPFGFLTEDEDLYQYIEINDAAVPIMNMLQAVPWLTGILYRWPLRLALPSDGDRVGFGRLMGLAKQHVEERLGPGDKPGQDMLQAFISSGMRYDDLVQHMFVQIVASTITTAAAIRHTLLALISTPTAYARLQKEIDESSAAGRISSPVITDAEANALPYLRAVTREGLRMWPPTTGLGSKQVPKGGDEICGYHVPAGTQVGANFYGVMRLKSVWGDDADAFRPERWLEAEAGGADRSKMLNSVLDLNFGSGKYQCLGKGIAVMELNKIYFELLRRYDFAVIDPHVPLTSTSGVFWVSHGLDLRLTRRVR